jgi:hypothetical protein
MLRCSSFRRLTVAVAILSFFGTRSSAVTEPRPDPVRLGFYEWMSVARIVIAADVVADDGPYVQAIARSAIKGDLAADAVVLVDLHRANRDREMGTSRLELTRGRAYLLLLQSSTRGRKEPFPVFDLVRGTSGAKALPIEGRVATIDAVARLADVQKRNNDDLLWATLPGFLEDPNPVLVDAALDLYVKFRRETATLAPVVQPLLGHPRPDFRRRAALLLGRVLARSGPAEIPERSEIVAALTGRARRDDDAEVRREATSALASLPDAGVDETLRTIARDDRDRDVRFEAEKSLFERSQGPARKRSD